jgi:hypothetical protein
MRAVEPLDERPHAPRADRPRPLGRGDGEADELVAEPAPAVGAPQGRGRGDVTGRRARLTLHREDNYVLAAGLSSFYLSSGADGQMDNENYPESGFTG